jgi:hypothetical protein
MDDLLTELGALALGSRLKRLADSLMQDGVRIYETVGSEFEPRWFPVFTYLYRRGPTSITEKNTCNSNRSGVIFVRHFSHW